MRINTINCSECDMPLAFMPEPFEFYYEYNVYCDRCMHSRCSIATALNIRNTPKIKDWVNARQDIGKTSLYSHNWNITVQHNIALLNGNHCLAKPLTGVKVSCIILDEHGMKE